MDSGGEISDNPCGGLSWIVLLKFRGGLFGEKIAYYNLRNAGNYKINGWIWQKNRYVKSLSLTQKSDDRLSFPSAHRALPKAAVRKYEGIFSSRSNRDVSEHPCQV